MNEFPDRVWWCHPCNMGVGVWGADVGAPAWCPRCHESDFAPIKFVQEVTA